MPSITQFLNPISAEAPCGPFVDPVGLLDSELRAPSGIDQDKFTPKWSGVAGQCEDLMGKSYHLHTGLVYSLALLGVNGLPGLVEGLNLMAGWFDKFWDSLHPTLDATGAPRDRAFERLSIVGYMRKRTFPEPYDFLYWLERTPIIRSQAVGEISLLSFQKAGDADNKIPWPEGQPVPNPEQILGAIKDVQAREPEALQATDKALTGLAEALKQMAETLKAKAQDIEGFDAANALLTQMRKHYSQFCEEAGIGVTAAPDNADKGASDSGTGGPAFRPGEIRSRPEVKKALKAILDFYDKFEPSSPVPILLGRAMRWSDMNFIEVLEDIALPAESITQVKSITGTPVAADATGKNEETKDK